MKPEDLDPVTRAASADLDRKLSSYLTKRLPRGTEKSYHAAVMTARAGSMGYMVRKRGPNCKRGNGNGKGGKGGAWKVREGIRTTNRKSPWMKEGLGEVVGGRKGVQQTGRRACKLHSGGRRPPWLARSGLLLCTCKQL